jgi:pilus assembly protein FimV
MKTHFRLTAGFTLTALASSHGWTLGLGDLTLNSYLNEPLSAQVQLLEAEALDENDVHVGLASESEFARLGVNRDFYLTKIVFEIQAGEDGKTVLMSTDTPLREPYLDFIIEARWPDGRLLREYTVLVDLPPRPQPVAEPASATPSQQATAGNAEGAGGETKAREYDRAVADRPAPGGRYLVTNTDTLWRIASDAAAPGVSVEQTMLEIVAANPAAFQGGNINGLKSGYVLQLPGEGDVQLALSDALEEVSLQNQEWAEGGPMAARGLTLVADEDNTDTLSANDDNGSVALPAPTTAQNEEPANTAVAETVQAPPQQEFDALIATVSSLQASVEALEAQLAARDAELADLRAELAIRDAAPETSPPITAPVGVTPEVTTSQPASSPLPVWPFIAGVATLALGGGALIWARRRQNRVANSSAEGPAVIGSAASVEAEAGEEGRLSDPQILASKVVEEAEIYIAYGRTDQAIEVLSEALAQGLSSPSLNMCLLECYVESGQVAEAGALLGRIEQGDDPDVLARARQLLLDAGVTSETSGATPDRLEMEETAEEAAEDSVLSEFSFSTDPAFMDDVENEAEVEADAAAELEPVQREVRVDVVETSPQEPDGLEEPEEEYEEVSSQSGVTGLETAIAADASEDAQVTVSSSEMASDELALDSAGLALAPLDLGDDVGSSEQPDQNSGSIAQSETEVPDISGLSLTPIEPGDDTADPEESDESIYGAETDPRDSKLDLARAYLDMGDEEGARPVLMEVIKEGDLAQQAEARELLLRLEAS